ncbi:TetR/AcrR family transcriptional regulator [Paenibacillus sp. UMB4589-SE434]|uniref:TetR/AcrR family transcriptional regulator n=1 Tax=Paenibacillus sp. UMB4589-SE434 TaxID=3046314 RepID=UPI00254F0D1E|nr:TetR/AcrR family transcriptional regulator [Paenibacillus sp. UMB4589-SE434]MDK8179528.1 TetR/AcrR family transcriptional regulator [Paenibacillus sp. UMB4589-SE434]
MVQSDTNNDTKAKILAAALDMIKEDGFESITIRKIAARSDTNISLVNYYFGSKDKLINEVIKHLLSGFQESFVLLDDLTLTPGQRLKSFLLHYVQVIQQYPELVARTIAMGTKMFTSQVEYGEFLQATGFHKVQHVLSEMTDEQQPDQLMTMLMQVFGAIFLPALMRPILEGGAGVNMGPTEQQIDLLFERYFHNHNH